MIPDDKIAGLNIPTGIPLVYELKDDLTPIRNYYLGDEETVRKATQAVAEQLKKKGHAPGMELESLRFVWFFLPSRRG
jgi:hypothetical protein